MIIMSFISDCYQENGKNYRGMVRKTRKGITCQKWNVNTPHRTRYADHQSVAKTDDIFMHEHFGEIHDTGKTTALLFGFILNL